MNVVVSCTFQARSLGELPVEVKAGDVISVTGCWFGEVTTASDPEPGDPVGGLHDPSG